jgi:DUF1365 family protein
MQGGYIGFGQVRHERTRPKVHQFSYLSYFLFLPMRRLQGLSDKSLAINQFSALSFYDRDHGDPTRPSTQSSLEWFEHVLKTHDVEGVDGDIWLHCFPRVWGYTFKPVSFWYGYGREGELKVILVEVNNTFGQRHCYLIKSPQLGREYAIDKVFHVSPFIQTKGEYKFRFMFTTKNMRESLEGVKALVRIDYCDEEGLLLKTSVSGELQSITPKSVRQAIWGYFWLTMAVILRIHYQALKLWWKGAQFHRSPPLPKEFITLMK